MSKMTYNKDDNNCSLNALVALTGEPYDRIYWMAAALGRKHGRSFSIKNMIIVLSAFGYKTKELDMMTFARRRFKSIRDRNIITLGDVMCNANVFDGLYMVYIYRHILAIVNGEYKDGFRPPRPWQRIAYNLYRVDKGLDKTSRAM